MSGFDICAYDHVGIRVTDRSRAIAFYQLLGFELEPEEEWEEHRALSMVTPMRVRVNLIYNAAAQQTSPHHPPDAARGRRFSLSDPRLRQSDCQAGA